MRMGQGVRTGFGHGGITCVLQTQFSSFFFFFFFARGDIKVGAGRAFIAYICLTGTGAFFQTVRIISVSRAFH